VFNPTTSVKRLAHGVEPEKDARWLTMQLPSTEECNLNMSGEYMNMVNPFGIVVDV